MLLLMGDLDENPEFLKIFLILLYLFFIAPKSRRHTHTHTHHWYNEKIGIKKEK